MPNSRIVRIAMMVGLLLALTAASFVAATLVAAHDDRGWAVPAEAKEAKNPIAVTPEVLSAAKALYSDKCAKCHGETGKGDGPESEMYDTPPTDFTAPEMLEKKSDGEIFWKITQGRRPMPAFRKQLTDEERWQLVHFVRTFAPKPEPEKPVKATPAKKSEKKNP